MFTAIIMPKIQALKQSIAAKETHTEEYHRTENSSTWWYPAACATAISDPNKAVSLASLGSWWESSKR